jgi:hypothetical protein
MESWTKKDIEALAAAAIRKARNEPEFRAALLRDASTALRQITQRPLTEQDFHFREDGAGVRFDGTAPALGDSVAEDWLESVAGGDGGGDPYLTINSCS